MPRLEKFSKKSDLAFSLSNQTEKCVGSEEVDALEQRRFRDEVDLHLGAMKQANANRRERERVSKKETIRKVLSSKIISKCIEYKVRMHGNA